MEIRIRVMVFNATLTIFQLYHGSVLLVEETGENH